MLVEVDTVETGREVLPPVWLEPGWVDPVGELCPPDWCAPDQPGDPIDAAVAELGVADRALARVLRAIARANPRDGLSVRRQVGLLAGATGSDVAFLDRAVEVLRGMPRTQVAFDDGLLSWSEAPQVLCRVLVSWKDANHAKEDRSDGQGALCAPGA